MFHSGNGQTMAVDGFGRQLLRLLESGPMSNRQLFTALVERALLSDDPQGRQRLTQALRQLHASAVISRYWPGEDAPPA